MAAEGPDQPDALYVVFNGGGAVTLRLPETAPAVAADPRHHAARSWRPSLHTARLEYAAAIRFRL